MAVPPPLQGGKSLRGRDVLDAVSESETFLIREVGPMSRRTKTDPADGGCGRRRARAHVFRWRMGFYFEFIIYSDHSVTIVSRSRTSSAANPLPKIPGDGPRILGTAVIGATGPPSRPFAGHVTRRRAGICRDRDDVRVVPRRPIDGRLRGKFSAPTRWPHCDRQ